jgi:SAM-dependent methyltransferase
MRSMRSDTTQKRALGCSGRPKSLRQRARWSWTGRVSVQGRARWTWGCGPRGVLDLLAARVEPGGRVVDADADPAHVAMATEFATGRGLGNVEIVRADARGTGLPSGSFDVVHARTLLITVPEPAVVAAEMARLARPGGWVVSVDPDTEYMLCYAASAAFDQISTFFPPVFSRDGADPWVGRRVPEPCPVHWDRLKTERSSPTRSRSRQTRGHHRPRSPTVPRYLYRSLRRQQTGRKHQRPHARSIWAPPPWQPPSPSWPPATHY